MSRVLLIAVLVSSGCWSHSGRQVAGALLLAGAAAVAQGVATAVTEAAASERRRAPAAAEVAVSEKEPCNYYMRCTASLGGRSCFFETNEGRIVPCQTWDCSEGAPAELIEVVSAARVKRAGATEPS